MASPFSNGDLRHHGGGNPYRAGRRRVSRLRSIDLRGTLHDRLDMKSTITSLLALLLLATVVRA
ncbi:MAG: hypothetical protein ABIR47_02350, partial [Candidatus Kapaibacterium sp.]